ncbi:MAG: NnrU family protein [Burkholderiaceae bacterium]
MNLLPFFIVHAQIGHHTMTQLLLGLILFLGIHSLRVFADGLRTRLIDRLGALGFKGLYSVVSIIGLVFIVTGYQIARTEPVVLYTPPTGMAHAASLLTLIAFVLLVAAYVPGNIILKKVKHPMTIAVKTWAFAHLLSNGSLADLVLFGSFLIWAVLVFRSARRRPPVASPGLTDIPAAIAARPNSFISSLVTVGVGIGLWAWFAFQGHALLIGVAPFGAMGQ